MLWKLTDFGFTTEGMSTAMIVSKDGRGTSGYRAPELLGEVCEFNTHSDIWALGSILHELITGRRVFVHDWATSTFYAQSEVEKLPLQLSHLSKFWQDETFDCLNDLLSKSASQRPSAGYVLERLTTYAIYLDSPDWGGVDIGGVQYQLQVSSRYLHWK
jgi:eukaryotic-like serine/threonine-protein kinase